MKLLLSIVVAAVLSGCVSLSSVSLTQIPKARKKIVTAEASRTIFLGFNFDNDYVDRLAEQLRNKCPGGKVSGILTKYETTSYFIVFKKTITARGYCSGGSGGDSDA